jgi:hypothetical protein
VSANFLIKIKKGEIRTANPTLSINAKRFNLAENHHSDIFHIALRNPKI